MPIPRYRNPWPSEEAMCDRLKTCLEREGWAVYPETHGFDIFAVYGGDDAGDDYSGLRHGDTMRVEAKMRPTFKLLEQVLGSYGYVVDETGKKRYRFRGVHWRAVLIPQLVPGFEAVVRALDIMPMTCARYCYEALAWVQKDPTPATRDFPAWARHEPKEPLLAPKLKVDMPAGVPCPRTVTPWKVAAVKMMLRLRAGEQVTSTDFAAVKLNHSELRCATFRQHGWLDDTGKRDGRFHIWKLGENPTTTPPDLKYPEIVAAVQRETTD